jgi:hypothetical protein
LPSCYDGEAGEKIVILLEDHAEAVAYQWIMDQRHCGKKRRKQETGTDQTRVQINLLWSGAGSGVGLAWTPSRLGRDTQQIQMGQIVDGSRIAAADLREVERLSGSGHN